jgi:FkbM family methyltransferase
VKVVKKLSPPPRIATPAAEQRLGTAERVDGLLNAVSADRSDAPIYFLHIPKTAGSSLTVFLQTLYDNSEICGLFPGWADLLRTSEQDIASSKLIRGHFGVYFNAHYPGALRCFTFLREPLTRALSHYEHVLRDPSHYLHLLATELGTFGAFMRDPRTRPTVSNFQLRHLAAAIDPGAIAPMLTDKQIADRELERRIDTDDLKAPVEELLRRAGQNLDRMCFVGITEQFDRSLGLLCEIFGWPAPATAPITNVNPRAASLDSLSDVDMALLTELNAADLALYESAKSRFEKDWARSRFVYPDLHAFVSYAQNFEDVLLHRVLAHVDRGVYIDVGANDPTGDSVTRAFYDSGWRGINVEPVTSLHKMLLVHRPRDINLQIASGAVDGETCLYEIPGTGLSTLDGAIANRHASMGFTVERRDIKVQTLDSVLSEHPLEVINFLKVDVEGWEREVLEGIDLTRHRPWIIVVEATEPNSQVPSFAIWESLLTSRRYRFAYFDGLNRYYVADEHPELFQGFSRPINCADHFIRWSELSAKRELRRLNWGLRRQTAASHAAEAHVAALTEWATSADRHGKALLAERNTLQTELTAERVRRATESSEAKRQIDALLDSQTVANAYCISLVERVAQLDTELSGQTLGRERDLVEAKKQIEALTESCSSADVYCKSLIARVSQLEDELSKQQQARELDLVEAKKQINALTESWTSADVYCKSLISRMSQLEDELSKQHQARALDLVEAKKQIDALTESMTSADAYCKSILSSHERLEYLLASERAEALSMQIRADDQLAAMVERATVEERNLSSLSALHDQLVQSRETERNAWYAEKSSLQSQLGNLQLRLSRLLQHWAVRTLVSKKFTSNTGKTKHE